MKNSEHKFKIGEKVIYCSKLSVISEIRGHHPANGLPLYDVSYDDGLHLLSLSSYVREDLLIKL